MGPVDSAPRPFMSDPYMIISENVEDFGLEFYGKNKQDNTGLKSEFENNEVCAKWSMKSFLSISPTPRSNHFSVYIPETEQLIFGYGLDSNNKFLQDIWAYQLQSGKFSRIQIDNALLSPRSGTTAVYKDGVLYLFGGFHNKTYISDFHMIDLSKKYVFHSSSDNEPCPRTGHLMAICGSDILIWGGYNGEWLNDAWIFNIETMKWKQILCDLKGRISTSSCFHGDDLYIFGSAKSDSLIRFDFSTKQFFIVKTSGVEPPPDISGSSLVCIDDYLFLVGGKHKQSHSLLYAFDVNHKTWFVFPIMPDGVSLNIADGIVNRFGQFMTPSISYSSVFYYKPAKSIIVIYGAPIIDPPALFMIDLSLALPIINSQRDVLRMLLF